MLGLFRSSPYLDPALGRFVRSRGRWRGTIVLGGTPLPLALAGSRREPDGNALRVAQALPETWSANREAVTRALVDYVEAYASAVADRVIEPCPGLSLDIAQAADIWRYVEIESASVTWFGDTLVSEVALRTRWDEEHTQGARFEDARFVEFNASIVPA